MSRYATYYQRNWRYTTANPPYHNCELRLSVGPHDVYLAIINPTEATCLFLAHYDGSNLAKLPRLLAELELSQQAWKQIVLIVRNQQFSLAPPPQLDPAVATQHMQVLAPYMPIITQQYLHTDWPVNFIFGIPPGLMHWVDNNCPAGPCRILHQGSALLHYFAPYATISEPTVCLFVENDRFHYLLFTNKGLQYYNCFTYHTPEDLVRYICTVLHVLHLSTTHTQLLVWGRIQHDRKLLSYVQTYIQRCNVGPAHSPFVFHKPLPSGATNWHIDLMTPLPGGSG